jgi:hypothetical protein
MLLFVVGFAGFFLGGWIVFTLVERRRRDVKAESALLEDRKAQAERGLAEALAKLAACDKRASELGIASERLARERQAFDARAVTRNDLEAENHILKRDLRNIVVTVRKLEMDRGSQAQTQSALDDRSRELAARYLADVEKWVSQGINANNFAASKQRLTKVIEWCRGIGFAISEEREAELLNQLKADFELEVRRALEREEQARIKAQIREEQQREKEIQRELAASEREKAAISAALAKALAEAHDEHSVEVDRLRARLAEAEQRNQRTLAQAQLTKAGHIYVISNIGSFGDRVFKIGMTRRLDPQERVDELGDASVPFPFDVHMMISCPDAPAMEHALHREFQKHRLNKVNPRKEFFRLELEQIRAFVTARHGEVLFTADAEALQYRQSVEMSEADQAVIDAAYSNAAERLGVGTSDD